MSTKAITSIFLIVGTTLFLDFLGKMLAKIIPGIYFCTYIDEKHE